MDQHGKILTLMIRRKYLQEWFRATDFMEQELGELFVGYEASARLSELYKDYKVFFETKKEGNRRLIKINFSLLSKFIYILPDDLHGIVTDELRKIEGRLI